MPVRFPRLAGDDMAPEPGYQQLVRNLRLGKHKTLLLNQIRRPKPTDPPKLK